MQHLDEGTIHAWLDGALDNAQAAETEAHVAQCASCSAAVAEARGLIAASSRILTALDDVPAGVIPKRAAPPVLKPARRQWRAAPWVSGIAAAALLFAIGIQQSRMTSKDAAFEGRTVQTIQRDTTASGYAPAAPAAPTAPSAIATSASDASVPARSSVVAGKGAGQDVGAQRQRLRRDGVANVATDTSQSKRVALDEVVATSSPSPPAAAPLAASVQEQKLADAKSPLSAAPAPALGAIVTTGARDMAKSEEPDVRRLAGCYRIEQASVGRLTRVGEAVKAVTGAAAGQRGVAGAARPQARAAEAPVEFARVMPPALVRLDTTRHPLGFVARDAGADTAVGSWNVVSADSARVDMMRAGLFTFAQKNRTTCPER